MKKALLLALITSVLSICLASIGYCDDYKTFASDSVGVKLKYPSSWKVEQFRWGFIVVEPQTQSTLSVRVIYFPKELTDAYDVNMNKEFMKVYGEKFLEVEFAKKEYLGLTWDYSKVIGARKTPLEYIEETYSTLINNTSYTFETYYNTIVESEVKDKFAKILESVKLMYPSTELPLVREYKSEWEASKAKNMKLEFATADNVTKIKYGSPWIFTGGGWGSDASFHYLSGNPFDDIDVITLRQNAKDKKSTVEALKTWVGLLTNTFKTDEEGEVIYGFTSYYYQKLSQGQGDNIVRTRIYAAETEKGVVIHIFSYHDKTSLDAEKLIDDFMNDITIKKHIKK